MNAAIEPATRPLLVDTVTERFRRGNSMVEALRGASLMVEPGEFLAVMGASGPGKKRRRAAARGDRAGPDRRTGRRGGRRADREAVVKDGRIPTGFATVDSPDAHALAARYPDVVTAPTGEGVAS